MSECSHLAGVPFENGVLGTPPDGDGCGQCLTMGSTWLHLRRCLTCGMVGCCDGSPNKHASKHARATEHALVQSFEPGEEWVWCYVDEVAMGITGAPPSPSHP